MAPRENRPSSESPPIHRVLTHVTISSRLTVNTASFQKLFESLGPISMELIEVYARYGDVPYSDQCSVLVLTLKEIWKKKDKLNGKEPGRYIANTVLRKLHAYLNKKGWADKWDQINERMHHDLSIVRTFQDNKN